MKLYFARMNRKTFHHSELILNSDGTVYHLGVKAEHVAPTVILVGDPGRVVKVSKYFDTVDFQIQNREFVTNTGTLNGKKITVMSSGIGTDNIDIVLTELDAAINIDPVSRKANRNRISLNVIRIGTSSSLHSDIPVGSMVISKFGLGFDGLMHYYQFDYTKKERKLNTAINDHLQWNPKLSLPYAIEASSDLVALLNEDMIPGITATAPGFYGPQGRHLNSAPQDPDINQKLTTFRFDQMRITNYEMETSALYGLGRMMGHKCCTCCAIIANRITTNFSNNYTNIVNDLIENVLAKITKN